MAAPTVAHRTLDADCFDPSVIDSLGGVMSASALRSLLTDMVRDASNRLRRLAEVQVAHGSLGLIERDAHDLRSLGGNFGLTALSQQAALIERASRAEDVESVRTAMPELLALGRKSITTLVERHKINRERAS